MRVRIPLVLFAALLSLTCDGTTPQEPPPTEPPPPAGLLLKAVTPVSTTGTVGEALAAAPVVLVTQEDGRPVEDVRVTFAASGAGSVGSGTVMTDAAGLATPGSWRLGPGAGPQTLTARAVGRSLVFTAEARPGPISSLAVVGGNGQWAAVGTPLPAPLQIEATDGYGNVVAGGAVMFEVVAGGGSLEPGPSITGADGIAESRWTLGTTAGRQHVQAQTGNANADFAAVACQPCSEVALELGGDIVIFDGTTGVTRQLTNDGVNNDPAWSPDGERIAFARTRSEDPQLNGIYVMNADGSGARRVSAAGYGAPTWSPQGDALAFEAWDSGCPDEFCGGIYVQELSEGSVMRRVATSGFAPAWSPDGSRIAFVGHNGLISDQDYYSLRLVNPDGSGLTEITQSTWFYMSGATWSPDGTRIAFAMYDVFVVRPDGTGLAKLTTQAAALTPAWSPDGTRIAYGQRWGGIMEIPAEGGEAMFMTTGNSPSWRP